MEENFELLPDNSHLHEFKNEMKSFKEHEPKFVAKVDSWITNIVMTAYDERNIEVHYNIVD